MGFVVLSIYLLNRTISYRRPLANKPKPFYGRPFYGCEISADGQRPERTYGKQGSSSSSTSDVTERRAQTSEPKGFYKVGYLAALTVDVAV